MHFDTSLLFAVVAFFAASFFVVTTQQPSAGRKRFVLIFAGSIAPYLVFENNIVEHGYFWAGFGAVTFVLIEILIFTLVNGYFASKWVSRDLSEAQLKEIEETKPVYDVHGDSKE